MRNARLMTVAGSVICGFVALTGAGCASGRVADAGDDRLTLMQLDREWCKAAADRDVERILAYWADDAVVIPPGRPPIKGKDAIRQFVKDSLAAPGFEISWEPVTATVVRGESAAHDLAYMTERTTTTINDAQGMSVRTFGNSVTVWRREYGGPWKCVVDTWNEESKPGR